MKKIRVAFFAEILVEDLDGATRTMFQLIKRIPRERFEFLFVCGVGPAELSGFECMRIPTLTLPINNTYKMALPALVRRSLREKLEQFNPDVVHIATPALLGEFAIKYAQAAQLPVISIYHTHFISYIDYYLKHAPFLIDYVKDRMANSHRTFYNLCDQIYVPSESIAAELSGIGVTPELMKIWKRGIDTLLFSPAKKDKVKLHKLTGNSYPTILFASRIVWEKNLDTLFRIYDHLKSRSIHFNLIMAGDGTARKDCELRMPDAIFTGKLCHEQLSTLMASADVFLFPSVSESYGNVILEAMASGLPCVIADGGGSKDFIEQGINGFKCAPYDEADYADRIIRIFDSPILSSRFTTEGLRYTQHFGWEQLADTYFEDVRQLVLNKDLWDAKDFQDDGLIAV